MKVQRLVVGKGKTTRHGDDEEWIKEYYEIEVLIEDPAELEFAKANLTGLIDGWLAGLAAPQGKEEALDFSKLFWEKKQGEKGEYEQTSEKANQNCDLWKQLKAKLKEHSGFWQNSGFKYWFDMRNENVVDRRKI